MFEKNLKKAELEVQRMQAEVERIKTFINNTAYFKADFTHFLKQLRKSFPTMKIKFFVENEDGFSLEAGFAIVAKYKEDTFKIQEKINNYLKEDCYYASDKQQTGNSVNIYCFLSKKYKMGIHTNTKPDFMSAEMKRTIFVVTGHEGEKPLVKKAIIKQFEEYLALSAMETTKNTKKIKVL